MIWRKNKLEDGEERILEAKKMRKEELLQFKLSRLEDLRKTDWKQRAHAHWMKEGGRNTKYFVNFASERKMRNQTVKL